MNQIYAKPEAVKELFEEYKEKTKAKREAKIVEERVRAYSERTGRYVDADGISEAERNEDELEENEIKEPWQMDTDDEIEFIRMHNGYSTSIESGSDADGN